MTRELKIHELHRLEEIGKSFTSEAKHPGGFSTSRFVANWQAMITYGMGVIFVTEEGNRITGTIGIGLMQDGFSDIPVALEQFWYVLPEFRTTRAGVELFRAFEKLGQQLKVKSLILVHLANVGADRLEDFYLKRGYHLVEKTYRKEL